MGVGFRPWVRGRAPSPVSSPSGVSGVLWTPVQLLADLPVWVDPRDATKITVTGGTNAVPTITSKGATPFALSQATTTRQPIYTPSGINGRPALQFVGTTFHNLTGTATGLAEGDSVSTFISVLYSTGVSPPQKMFSQMVSPAGSTGSVRSYGVRNGYPDSGKNGADHTLSGAAPQYNGNVRLVVTQSGGGQSKMWVDGNPTPYTAGLTFATVGQFLVVGKQADSGDGEGLNGLLGEFLDVSRALTDAERQRLEGYLANGWGLTLFSGHPYQNSAPYV